jgi:hypothetical protein
LDASNLRLAIDRRGKNNQCYPTEKNFLDGVERAEGGGQRIRFLDNFYSKHSEIDKDMERLDERFERAVSKFSRRAEKASSLRSIG